MQYFVRQSIKGGRCAALNQYYKSTISDEVFNNIPKELDLNGNICEILDKYFEYENKHRKTIENEYVSKFEVFRDVNQDWKSKHVSDKLSELPIHEKLQQRNLNDVMMDLDATSLYPSAMWDDKSLYPKIETGFALEPHVNDVYVDAFNNQTFNQDGNESANLKLKYYNPSDLIFQHLPVKENVKNIEINSMRKLYFIETLTSVDIQDIVKNGGKVIEIYEGVVYKKTFRYRLLEKL